MRMLAALVFAIAELSTSVIALALPTGDVPTACAGDANSESAYRNGFQLGRGLVQRAWLKIADCSQFPQFLKTVRANISSYNNRAVTAYGACRYAGMVDGVNEELLRIQASCR